MPPSNSGMPMPRWVERFISALEKWNQSTTKMEKVSQGLRGAMNLPGRISSSLTNAAANPLAAVGNRMAGLGAVATGPAAAATSGLGAAIAPIAAVGQQMAQFVGKANPAIVERFNLALDDTMAVIGQTLEPLFEVMVDLMREMGDSLKTLQPAMKPFVDALAKIMRAFMGIIEPLTRIVYPALELIGQLINSLVVPMIELFADSLKWLVDKVQVFVDFLIDMANELIDAINSTEFGRMLGLTRLTKPSEVKKESSIGAAVRPASYVGIEEIGRMTSEEAFGTAGKISKGEELIANEVKRLREQVEKYGMFGGAKAYVGMRQQEELNRLGVSR